MDKEQIESTGVDSGDAQQELKTVEELRTSIDSLVETITEQVAKEEEEKLKASELQAKEEKALAEQEELQMVSTEEEDLAVQEFRTQVEKSLSEINTNLILLNESTTELKEIELQNQEMFNQALPSVKQASDLAIIFLCLIPIFIVYKWIASMFNSAF